MIEIEKPKMVTSDVSEDGRYGKFDFGSRSREATASRWATACVVCCCPPCRVLQ